MYTNLTSWDNLLLAYRRASKGKRSQPAVAAFEYHLEDHLLALQASRRDRTYRPGAYTHFYIHEPKRAQLGQSCTLRQYRRLAYGCPGAPSTTRSTAS